MFRKVIHTKLDFNHQTKHLSIYPTKLSKSCYKHFDSWAKMAENKSILKASKLSCLIYYLAPHTWHWNGFSSLCVTMWSLIQRPSRYSLPQMLQATFWAEWVRTCLLQFSLLVYILWHIRHLYLKYQFLSHSSIVFLYSAVFTELPGNNTLGLFYFKIWRFAGSG